MKCYFHDPRLFCDGRPQGIEACGAPGVDEGDATPRWLDLRIRRVLRAANFSGDMMISRWGSPHRLRHYLELRHVTRDFIGHEILDHWGVSRSINPNRKQPILVTEPYWLDIDLLVRFRDAMRELEAGVEVHAASAHFPTNTIRIEVFDLVEERARLAAKRKEIAQ